jgi:multidrug efflux system membrane fusion protein
MRSYSLPLLMVPVLMACSPPPAQVEPVRAVRTLVLQTGETELQNEYAAEIRARTEARLSFRVGGKLVRRPVNVGDVVKAGQVLAQIDASDLKLGQDAARAAVSAADTQLALNEAEYRRYKELRDQGFISGLELERREASLKASRAQAEQARAQASVQGNQAGYAVLVADVSGVVTAVDAEPGAVLAAGTPVLRVAQDGPRDAVFSVSEDRLPALRALLGKPGAVQMRPWGSDLKLPATVREVAAAADPTTRTFLVKADIGRTDLRLGQTATVLIDAPAVAGLFKLPLPAVFEQGGQSHVWVVDPAKSTVRAQPIAVVGAEGNLVLVGAGLANGLRVVTAGVHTLTPGQVVRLYAEPRPATVQAQGPTAVGAAALASASAPTPTAASSAASAPIAPAAPSASAASR